MTRAGRALPVLVLLILGAAWAMTQPLTKIAVGTGHQAFGLLVWQLVISVALLVPLCRLRGKRLPLHRRALALYLAVALLGTVIPNSANYRAAVELPAGIMSIIISTVAMFTFPMAIALGIDRFAPGRLLGLVLGLVGIVLIALPEASLPGVGAAPFVLLSLFAAFSYACEGIWLGARGTEGLDPIQTLLGASILALIIALPLALLSGHWIDPLRPWGAPELAISLSSVLHVAAYVGYVWLVGVSGAVFAAQLAYLVTGFGVVWSMLLLGESYAATVWAAMALILVGLALVQPRPAAEHRRRAEDGCLVPPQTAK